MEEKTNLLIKNLDNIIRLYQSTVEIEKYFKLSLDEKITSQYLLLKVIGKTIMNEKYKYNQETLKHIIHSLISRGEEIENYEIAEISKNTFSNFDKLYVVLNDSSKTKRIIKTNKVNEQ